MRYSNITTPVCSSQATRRVQPVRQFGRRCDNGTGVDGVSLSDIAKVIGAVGGAAVVTIFNDKQLFGLYSIGLAVGFFGYLIAYVMLNGREETKTIVGQGDTPIELNE
jgi:hypothetical protein